MKRRALLLASGAWIVAGTAPSLGQAQQTTRRIVALLPGSQSGYQTRFQAFRSQLEKLGHVEGRNFVIEQRYADDRMEQLGTLAAEVVALGPVAILTASSAGVIACRKATSTIPIVFASAGNPVEQGLVSSLRRPGGNVTGVATLLLDAKIVELARQALPNARRFAILVHDPDPASRMAIEGFVAAAKRYELSSVVVRVRRVEELARAFDEVLREKVDALYLPSLVFMGSHGRYLAERALEARLPMLSGRADTTAAGGLLSYAYDRLENFRRAAVLVDKILRGARPGDLPIEEPEKLELTINLKTAKAIGVTIPKSTLARADRIID